MKIYRIRPDVNHYQYLMLEDAKIGLTEMLDFDGTPKGNTWVAPDVFILEPMLEYGHFSDLWAKAALVVNEVALESLRGLLEMSGELLPLPCKDRMYHVLNVTGCFNLLDEERTQWLYDVGQLPIRQYAFHANRLVDNPIFKIPETRRYEILTCEGLKDSADEFKGRVEQLGLKGLVFEELWRD